MTEAFEDFDALPAPPELVYKYVSGERTDVLEHARIRFTPPINTNDIFEVRQTFELLIGPKAQQIFDEQIKQSNINQILAKTMNDMGLGQLSLESMKLLMESVHGVSLEQYVRGSTQDRIIPYMNSPKTMDDLLMKVGHNLICLSFSETPYCSPLWAHYADNSRGFVIAFKTTGAFFHRGEEGERNGLFRIRYRDEKLREPLDNPVEALMSKTSDWAYEREWRLYTKRDDADLILGKVPDEIHLVSFPKATVDRVILGPRASIELETKIRNILDTQYNSVPLVRLRADRSTASFVEEAI